MSPCGAYVHYSYDLCVVYVIDVLVQLTESEKCVLPGFAWFYLVLSEFREAISLRQFIHHGALPSFLSFAYIINLALKTEINFLS